MSSSAQMQASMWSLRFSSGPSSSINCVLHEGAKDILGDYIESCIWAGDDIITWENVSEVKEHGIIILELKMMLLQLHLP